jgi:hypothetical protein
MQKIQCILAFILALNISSCTSDPISSSNRYIINNQSSTDLFYNTGSGLDERTIEIPRFKLTVIEEAAFEGDRATLISAEDVFIPTEDPIYLLKEVNGNLIEALQLNTTGVLNWETEMANDFTYDHILQVTDELLN